MGNTKNTGGLLEKLADYGGSAVRPFHMPGHKRNTAALGTALPYGLDITEIHDFDNLHGASGILKETMDGLSALYGSRRSFVLVNGSTGGILAGIRSAVRPGDRIVMARNCHMSVYNAVEINALRPVFLQPETDAASGIHCGIRPEQVADALALYDDVRLVVLTSPTYEGVVSDIPAIAEIAHAHGIPVLVDAAHGAHLGFSDAFPASPLQCGADLVVCGLHKTMPVLTQCAALHIGGTLVDPAAVERAIGLFETSSPSYILMASADRCVRLLQAEGPRLFAEYDRMLRQFDAAVAGLRHLQVLCHGQDSRAAHPGFWDFDPGKLVISTRRAGMTGAELAARLRTDYQIETEMAYADYVIAMTSFCDVPAHLTDLGAALCAIDAAIADISAVPASNVHAPLPERLMDIAEACRLRGTDLTFTDAVGMVSLEYVWAYPPGIPILTPGEVIGPEQIAACTALMASGIALSGTFGGMPARIRVKSEKNAES